jgi:hypothetical protein
VFTNYCNLPDDVDHYCEGGQEGDYESIARCDQGIVARVGAQKKMKAETKQSRQVPVLNHLLNRKPYY